MLIYSLNFLFGILLFSFKNTLEISSAEWVIIGALVLVGFMLFKRFITYSLNLGVLLLGFAWMGIISTQILSVQINNAYLNKPILVTGKIIELPEKKLRGTNFVFKANSPFQGRLKLSWYQSKKQPEIPNLNTGDTWQLLLKIKHNNGYQNLSGFDYEKWLFFQRIQATGYVRDSLLNKHIKAHSNYSINKLRQFIQRTLLPILSQQDFGGIINALIIGDRSFITNKHWELFKSTNTTHLSVISGLHIGLISGFVFLLVRLLWRQSRRLVLLMPAQIMGAYAGLIASLFYALIAGFSVPTQRAFIMTGVLFIATILRRHHNIWQIYAFAIILVLITNPLHVLSIGFWLSFYVVGIIIYGSSQYKNKSKIYRLIYIQLLITIATIPLIAWFFSSGSVISPVANLIAIPVFSLITVPLSLIGALFTLSGSPYLGEFSFSIANQSLVYLAYFLEYLQKFNFNLWHYSPSFIDFINLILAVLIGILPKELKLRWLSALILVLILFTPVQKSPQQQVLITTLDVGQGLSTVVQTKNHTLLFDTGAIYRSGFNLGDAVISPYLSAKKIQHLDKIILSHGDNDHIGGLKAVLKTFSVGEILTSEPNRVQQSTSRCEQGQQWTWDDVNFQMLSPAKNTKFKGNNISCVLKISTKKYSALLTGDIEKQAEHRLVKTQAQTLKSDILIVPHHGSKTSSTQAFISAVSPTIAIISSGFKNHFNHPPESIIKRYKNYNIQVLQTNCSGQIDITLGDAISYQQYRKEFARYYTRQCED